MTTDSFNNPVAKARKILWLVLAVSAILCVVLAVWKPKDFFTAWLAAILWPWSICFGCLILRLIFVLTGGRWGVAAFPWISAGARLFPLVLLLFIPWALGLDFVYSWMDPEIFKGIENTEHRQLYFQPTFVILRTLAYFGVWCGLSLVFVGRPRWGFSVDPAEQIPPVVPGGEGTGGLGLLAVFLAGTWAAMDWVMSLDPHFMSTLFGALICMGALLSGLAMATASYCFHLLHSEEEPGKALPDLANLMLAFVMLWAYMSFAQFLIMWAGDLPREAYYYQTRMNGPWHAIALVLIVSGFMIPFGCLMSYDFKRSPRKVGYLAGWLLLVRLVELWWLVFPHTNEKARAWNWAIFPTAGFVVSAFLLIALGQIRSADRIRPLPDPSHDGSSRPEGETHE